MDLVLRRWILFAGSLKRDLNDGSNYAAILVSVYWLFSTD
jgi:hypothetical protein